MTRSLFITGCVLLAGAAFPAAAQEGPSIAPFESFEKVSERRVGRTTYEFVYRARATGAAEDLTNVRAAVTSSSAATTIADGLLDFGDLAGGGEAVSTDVFSFQHNLLVPFDPGVFSFTFEGEPVPGGGDLTVTTELADFVAASPTFSPEGGETAPVPLGGGATLSVIVPNFAVTQDTQFTVQEVRSVDGLPDGVRFLAGARFGPSGAVFPDTVSVRFNVSGLRTPGSALVGLRASDDGTEVQLLPLTSADGTLDLVETAQIGQDVILDTPGFSDLIVLEVFGEAAGELTLDSLDGTISAETSSELALAVLSAALGTEIDPTVDVSVDSLADDIRSRRSELSSRIEDFMNRDVMTVDMFVEFTDLQLAVQIINKFDRLIEATSQEENLASASQLAEFGLVYLAGLHLQCFVNPEGINDVLLSVALSTLQRAAAAAELAGPGAPDIDFQALLNEAAEFAECYSPEASKRYFESFDRDEGDFFEGVRSNGGTLRARLFDPTLEDESPLTFEFSELNDGEAGEWADLVRIQFVAPGTSSRTATMELEDIREMGGLFSTDTIVKNGNGTMTVTPTSISMSYSFVETTTRRSTDGTVQTFVDTGSVLVRKEFTPRTFAEEIDLDVE